MRVLLVSGEFPPMLGGVGDYTARLASALVEQGAQVAVLTSRRAQGGGPFPFPVLAQVRSWNFRSWPAVRQAIREYSPHILHIQYQAAAYDHHPAINLLPLRARLGPWPPLVFTTFHDLRVPYLFPKAGRLRPWAILALARWSRGAIFTVEEDYRAIARCGFTTKTYLIPIGSNIPVEKPSLSQVRSWKEQLGLGQDAFLVGYFGLLNQSKGVDVLMRAYRVLLEDDSRVALVMVGATRGDSDPTNAGCEGEIRALVRELGLEGRVGWTGYLSPQETSLALQCLDVCVLPYRDGASLRRGTLMAALAHGLPIVTTAPAYDSGSAARLVDGENCRLVPADDPQALAEAIKGLGRSATLRQRLAQGARQLAAFFSWPRIGEETLRAYQEVLSLHGSYL